MFNSFTFLQVIMNQTGALFGGILVVLPAFFPYALFYSYLLLLIRKSILRKTTSCKLKIRAFKTRQQFCGDISTLFQSHCQTRILEIELKYHRKIVVLL